MRLDELKVVDIAFLGECTVALSRTAFSCCVEAAHHLSNQSVDHLSWAETQHGWALDAAPDPKPHLCKPVWPCAAVRPPSLCFTRTRKGICGFLTNLLLLLLLLPNADGCAAPTIAVLYEDTKEQRHVKTYEVSLRDKVRAALHCTQLLAGAV